MIGIVLIAAAAIGYWAWRTRDAQVMRFGDVAAVIAALIALRLFTRGEALPGLLALGGAGWWYWFRRQGGDTRMSRDEAARVLSVAPSASREEIKAAHRRLIARVHPDAGGSADLTHQVNAARDTLLAGSR